MEGPIVMANKPLELRFALLGKSGVGKTSLFMRYFSNSFGPTVMTLNADLKKKRIFLQHLNNQIEVDLSVWDTIGMETYQELMPQYYRAVHGFIFVYDTTNRLSFEHLDNLFTDTDTFATIEGNVKIIVGSKIDLKESRVVSRSEGLKYAHSKGALFIEASALTSEAVDHIFEKLVFAVLEKPTLWNSPLSGTIKLVDSPPVTPSSSCCC